MRTYGSRDRELALWALVRRRSVTRRGQGDEERAVRVLRGELAPNAWGHAVIQAAKEYPALADDLACGQEVRKKGKKR